MVLTPSTWFSGPLYAETIYKVIHNFILKSCARLARPILGTGMCSKHELNEDICISVQIHGWPTSVSPTSKLKTISSTVLVRAATDESQKTRSKKQETKRFSTFAVYRLRHSETKKNIAWFENQVLAEHVRKSQSTIYLQSHGCVHGFQNEVSLINFSTMFCKPCSLSRNRSLRDAKSARHMFVWFAKHCSAEHCLLFRGDADECQKQFCFVFRICLAFFDSRLWRPLVCITLYTFVHASSCICVWLRS